MTETILSTIEGSSEDERLLVALCHESLRGSRIELRQQSWGEGVGWFTQSKVELQPEQLNDLRLALGAGGRPARPAAQKKDAGFCPRVVHAESA